MLEKLLSKLGASTRITVGVSVSPNVGLEMIEVDKPLGVANKYSCRPLEYNSSTREIADYEQFKIALESLFEELNIPRRSNIVLSLPDVHFGMINLPLLLTDDAVTNAIVSEVEQSYIFKRQDPVVSWTGIIQNSNTENRLIAYSAIQKNAMEQIKAVCDEIGCSIVCIENSYSSLLRALSYLELSKEQMRESVSWNLMVILPNNYSIFSMSGKKVLEYYEEPLALKSFVDDEIYNAIKTSAQLTLSGLPANYLFIVSETDLVSAEVLSMKMPFDGTINFLECNKFVQNEIMPINLNILPNKALQITPESIGATLYPFSDFPLKLNFIKTHDGETEYESEEKEYPRINIGNLEIELTPAFIGKISLILAATTVVPVFIILMLLNQLIIPKEQKRLETMESNIKTLDMQISRYEGVNRGQSFDVYSKTDEIVSKNKLKMAYYGSLGFGTPDKLWITYYKTNNSGKIDIKGASPDVKSIYTFYKNIKQMINNSDIKLRKLEIASDTIDAVIQDSSSLGRLYEFEITNMTEGELNVSSGVVKDKNATTPAEPQITTPQPAENKSSFPLSNSFFGNKQNAQQTNQNEPSDSENLPPNLKKIEKF